MNDTKPLRDVYTVEDIRANAERAGSYFFTPETMRAWGSRVLSGVIPSEVDRCIYFITSERPRYANAERRYTVRRYEDGRYTDGGPAVWITTEERGSEGDDFTSAHQARRFARLRAVGCPAAIATWLVENGERDTEAGRVMAALSTMAA